METLRYLNIFLSATFVLAFMVFLVTSNVRLAFNSTGLYEFGFDRHNVDRTTGLTEPQLSDVATEIRDYFNSDEELLDVRVVVNGNARALFNEREIIHMRDVKELLHAVYRVQEGTFLYLFTFSTVGFLILGSEFSERIRRLFFAGTVFIYGTMGVVGLVSLVGFNLLFRWFHEVSFNNDFWILDPSTSFLVRLFPQGFWLESTLLLGMATLAESGGIVALIALAGWWQRRRGRIAASKQPQFL